MGQLQPLDWRRAAHNPRTAKKDPNPRFQWKKDTLNLLDSPRQTKIARKSMAKTGRKKTATLLPVMRSHSFPAVLFGAVVFKIMEICSIKEGYQNTYLTTSVLRDTATKETCSPHHRHLLLPCFLVDFLLCGFFLVAAATTIFFFSFPLFLFFSFLDLNPFP